MKKKDRVSIIEVSSEIGAGTRGASLGPRAIEVASLNVKSNYFTDRKVIRLTDQNHILFENREVTFAKNIDGLLRVFNDLSKALSEVMDGEEFPIILAGDHSSAAGSLAGLKRKQPEKRMGAVWIDAHADLHSPYTTPSGNVHGMPLAIVLDEDNIDMAINQVSEASVTEWTALKSVAGVKPVILHDDLAFIAVRDTEEPEDYLIKKHGIKNHSVADLRAVGARSLADQVLNSLSDCDSIYITFDVDSMDPDLISYGTGTPVKDGLSENEAIELLIGLLQSDKICCLEITEVNPTLDEKKNRMAETAFRILERVTAEIEK